MTTRTTATESGTCQRCSRVYAKDTKVLIVDEGTIHHHCGTASERGADRIDLSASGQRGRQRPTRRLPHWRRPNGELSYDC